MTESVLQEAERLINGDRQDQYGNASESFNRIAGLWSAYTGTELTGLDVANLMVLLKVSRTKGTFHRDSYVDIGGYAGLGERLHEEAAETVVRSRAPRQWMKLGKVPRDVSVRDVGRDLYAFDSDVDDWRWGSFQIRCHIGEDGSGFDGYAPFVEVVE